MNEKTLERINKDLRQDINYKHLPLFYSKTTLEYNKSNTRLIIFNSSKEHNTDYYSVQPFYKPVLD